MLDISMTDVLYTIIIVALLGAVIMAERIFKGITVFLIIAFGSAFMINFIMRAIS